MQRFFSTLNRRTVDFPSSIEAFAHDGRAVERALSAVPMLYFFLLYIAFSTTSQWFRAPQYDASLFDPLWPVTWLSLLPFDIAVQVICGIFLGSMLIGAVFFSRRASRILAFLGFWQFHAFLSSFGTPDHTIIVWFYPLLFFIFLPDLWHVRDTSVAQRKFFLMAFFGAQVYTGIVYFLAGFGKLWDGVSSLLSGNGNFLASDAFALHISYWLDNTGSTSVLGHYIVANPYLGWPFFVVMIYLQVFSLWAVFRPSLHRVWGAILISFHIATFLTMNILFINSILVLAALFLNSPFERPGTTLKERAVDVPLFGMLLRPWLRRG